MISICSEDSLRSALKDDGQIQLRSEEISEEIISNRLDISTLVESLSFALTATEVELRAQGTKLLSATLSNLPADFLSSTQLHFIVQFYCDRSKDHHSVIPALLLGIFSVCKMTHVPAGGVAQIMQTLFKNVSCQSQVREDRQIFFNILQTITEKYVEELVAMGSDFVYGVINAIDGERDPRILFSIFDFLPSFLRTFPLAHLAEEMFEVCACYFPVDFHPAPDDPTSISRDGLAERLARCMCGHPEFAEFCIPLALEKLNSQLTVAKLDSLSLLILGAQNFPADQIESQFKDIWAAIHIEIRLKDDKPTDISRLALTTLRTIVQSTSYNESLSNNVMTHVMDSIISSVTDPDSKYFPTSTTIAITAAGASKSSALFVARKLLPLLILQTELFRDNSERLAQIHHLTARLIDACVLQKVTQHLDEHTVNTIRSEYIAGMSSNTANDTALLNILACLTATAKILNEHNRLQIYSNVNDLFASPSDQIVQQTRDLLIALATDNPNEFRTTFLDNWLHSDVVKPSNAKHIFGTLGCLVRIPEFTDTALGYLLRHVFEESDFRHLAIHTIESLLSNGIESAAFDRLYTNFNVVLRLSELIRSISPSDADLLANVSNCVRLIVQQLDSGKQSSIIAQPFVSSIDLTSIGDLYLAASIVGAVRPDVSIDVEKFGVNAARQALLQRGDRDSSCMACRLLCSVVNKAPRSERNDAAVATMIAEVQEAIQNGVPAGVMVLAWIGRGLLVSGDSRSGGILALLIDLLDSNTLGDVTADAFNIITSDLSVDSLPVVRPLYKQKLYHTLSGRLLTGNVTTLAGAQLRSFAYVLRMVPYQVLNLNIEKVGPILFKCLDHEDPVLVQIAIQKIDWYLSSQHDYFRVHLQHLIQSYLKLTAFKASMHIRVEALNALQTIAKYPPFVLVPFRSDVLLALQTSLDDPKRLVRNSAVIARNRWFMIGVPAEKK